MDVEIKTFTAVDDGVLDALSTLETAIFDKPYSRAKLGREATVKHNLLVLIAYDGETPVAYKVGYELSSRLYYSWIGGVHPNYRKQGLATRLMELQHSRILQLGHSWVRTYTENKYRDMLVLNLKTGFDVIGVYKSEHDEKQTIILEKQLS